MVTGSRTHYLLAYNTCCFLLWALIAVRSILCLRRSGTEWFDEVGHLVTLAMTLALMEIFHAALGFVRSSAATTAMQVCSRLHMCYLVWPLLPECRYNPASRLVVISWALSELCRYPFYICHLMDGWKCPYWLKWLRYSAFLILYPSGILGEVLTMCKAVLAFRKVWRYLHWPIPMPNALNFELSLSALYIWALAAYVPGSYYMYTHMLRQRSKALRE